MLRIFKYEVTRTRDISLQLPTGSQVLHFDMQRGKCYLWAMVDPDPAIGMETRRFLWAETGGPIHERAVSLRYVNTILEDGGRWVLHFFEVL